MRYINHLTLITGNNLPYYRGQVGDSTLHILTPWLNKTLESGEPESIPAPGLEHFSAQAVTNSGALLMTVFAPHGPFEIGKSNKGPYLPLVTFGVATRSRHANELWDLLVTSYPVKPELKQPQTPWCAVAIHPTATIFKHDINWLADFERCIAWTWILHNKDGLEEENDD